MDVARLLVSRVVQDASLAAVLDRRVQPEMCPDPESRHALAFCLEHMRKHGEVPSPALVEEKLGFRLPYAPDAASYYVDELVSQFQRNQLTELILAQAPAVATADDPGVVAEDLRRAAASLLNLGVANIETDMAEDAAARYDRYLKAKEHVGLLGLPTAFATLDQMTQGWLPECFAGFVGRPGTGKTFQLLLQAHAAWLAGADVMFVNKELSTEMMDRRSDALIFRLPYERFRNGALSRGEEERYKDGLADLEAKRGQFANVGSVRWVHGTSTVSGILGKVEEHRPDLLIVDGAYLLMDEERGKTDTEKQKNISRGIKMVAQRTKVPTIISIQLNRDGDAVKTKRMPTLSDVYGSDAYAQDVDYLFALTQNTDQRDRREMHVLPLKTREAAPIPFAIRWDFDQMLFADLGTIAEAIEADGERDFAP